MSISLYQASVPVYARQLNGLAAILQKAISYCVERKIEPAALLHGRLYPDMFTLVRQDLKPEELLTITPSNAKRLGFGGFYFYGSTNPPATPQCSWEGFTLRSP